MRLGHRGRDADDAEAGYRLGDTRCMGGWAGKEWKPREYSWEQNDRSPEVSSGLVSGESGSIAIALSGGGMRSFALACGQCRALVDCGKWDSVRYLSASSGGAWFALSLWCADGDLGHLLGEIVEAKALRLANLGTQLKDGCLRSAAARSVGVEVKRKLGRTGWPAFGSFEAAVEAALNETLFLPFSGNSLEAAAKPGRPWIIAGVSVLGPWREMPFDEKRRSYRCWEASPLCFGAPGSTRFEGVDIGGWIESASLGAREHRLDAYVPGPSVTAAKLAVYAGLAHADYVASHQTRRLAPAHTLARRLTSVALNYPTQTRCIDVVVGDGGIVDNLNLLPLVRRDSVRDIIALCNFETPLNDTWDPYEREPRYDAEAGSCLDLDASLASYFGIDVVPDEDRVGYYLKHNQCFDRTALAPLVARLQAAASRGTGAVAAIDLKTVENQFYNIPAGMSKRLIVVYLGRCEAWERQLTDPDLKRLLLPQRLDAPNQLTDKTNLVQDGRFQRFPHLAASGPFAPPFDNASVDLLGSFAGAVLKDNMSLIDTILTKPFGFFDCAASLESMFPSPHPATVPDAPQHTIKQARRVRRKSSLKHLDTLVDGR